MLSVVLLCWELAGTEICKAENNRRWFDDHDACIGAAVDQINYHAERIEAQGGTILFADAQCHNVKKDQEDGDKV